MAKNVGNSGDSIPIALVVMGVLVLIFGMAYMRFGLMTPTGPSNGYTPGSESTYTETVSPSGRITAASVKNADILTHARAYLEKKPEYKDDYYATGYPDDNCGVCTDVIGFALRDSGYDIMELLYQDELRAKKEYNLESDPDKCIDFRRVNNLKVYLRRNAITKTTNIFETDEWMGGDIVVWDEHIGVISDKRNSKGIPYVLHHTSRANAEYEEDILETNGTIEGHFRLP